MQDKREQAYFYYMQGEMSQKIIASKIGVSENTISKWCEKEGWEAKRAGISITRPELVNKTLKLINNLIERVSESDNLAADAAKTLDSLSKAGAFIEKLDKRITVIDTIEVSIALSKWIEYRLSQNPEHDVIMSDFVEKITEIVESGKQVLPRIASEFQKAFNKYQDLYINEQLLKK